MAASSRAPALLIDPAAESALLGVLMREPQRFSDRRVCRALFASPPHPLVFDRLLAAYTAGALGGDLMTASAALEAEPTLPMPRSLAADAYDRGFDVLPSALITHVSKLAHRRQLRQLGQSLAAVADFPHPESDADTLATIAARTVELSTNGAATTTWTSMDTVTTAPISWLWSDRIPFGALSYLDGDPGLGKTALTLDLAARVSTGTPLPDDPEPPWPAAGVVLINAEDDLPRTLRPRLDAAGADCTKIAAFDFDHLPIFPAGLSTLRDAIRAVHAALVVIDPVMALLDASVDAYRDQDVRRVLRPLTALAADTNTAILLVRHLTKQTGPKALYRGGGSIGFAGTARAGLLLAEDPDDQNARILAPLKNNWGPKAPALRFAFDPTPDRTLRLSWGAHAPTTADQLLAPPPSSPDSITLSDAVACLQSLLADGDCDADTADQHRKKHHISAYAWRLARARLGVRAIKNGTGHWSLHLP